MINYWLNKSVNTEVLDDSIFVSNLDLIQEYTGLSEIIPEHFSWDINLEAIQVYDMSAVVDLSNLLTENYII